MTTFIALLVLVGAAYRVFVKGESIIDKTPNWKTRGLEIVAMGSMGVLLSVFVTVSASLHHLPIPGINWAMLVVGGSAIALGVRVMKRSPVG
jgi:hypothetical protein